MRPSRIQVSRRATGQVSGRDPRPISTSRHPVLPRMVSRAPSGKISIQPEPSSVWRGPQSRPTISDRRRPPAKPIARIARSRRPLRSISERRQHGQKLVGEDRGFLQGRAGVAAADAGEDGGDMAVTDVERLAELPVAPGDAGQPPLEGRDREFRAAAFDLGREVEADRLRVGRRLRKPLAAQPGGEHFPVGGVGALGVIGLRRAGVGLGGLRERRQAAAEAPGGREQGRGVRAGSLGLERRAFRLPAVRAVPDAFVRTALRVGWRAGAGRGGAAVGADQRGQGGGAWRGGLVPPGFRGLGLRPPGAALHG